MKRRHFILSATGLLGGAAAWRYWPEDGFTNECISNAMPEVLQRHPLVQSAIAGIDFNKVMDNHVHVVGLGENSDKVWVNPEMESWAHPIKYAQLKFYLDGSCVSPLPGTDESYIQRIAQLSDDLPRGMKLMVMAFDYFHDQDGKAKPELSTIYTANEYVAEVAARFPERMEWIASIHPYRVDAVERLKQAVKLGARAVKWLPEAMGIDPGSDRCDAFYQTMKDLNIPLLSHAGHETAVGTEGGKDLGNPLLLRRPLDQGVRVIVAHCASLGNATDLDKGADAEDVPCFDLFVRMMEEEKYRELLFGDISAMLQLNRLGQPLKYLLQKPQWHSRLINGSDYPLPGILPVFSLKQMLRADFLNEQQAQVLSEVRRYNPVWFDFLVKRMVRWEGHGFDNSVFENKHHFIS